MGSLPEALTRRVAAEVLSTDPDDLATYGRDWTRVYAPSPVGVARPRDRAEVGAVLAGCREAGLAVVPSGGRTGLAGGAVAARGELVLSLDRMRRMDPVDLLGATVRVEAGAVTAAVHAHCAPHGLTWPIDFASKGSSTIGGNIATNAGGVRVIRYGLTRQWVLGLEVSLMTGEALDLGGALEKNNTGVDLRQLFIGSEGTLGVVTAATLKLAPLPGRVDVALLAAPTLADVVAIFRAARRSGLVLGAFEFFTDRCLARLLRHRALRRPFAGAAGHYALVEIEGAGEDAVADWIAGLVGDGGPATDAVIAQSAAQAGELWALREGISESLAATGLPHKNDIALPVAALEGFCGELDAVFAARYPGWEVCNFGHIGDGNLHVNVMKPDGMEKEAFFARCKDADADMFELVRRHRGSISAEHGVGLLKRDHLGFSRSEGELALMRAVKQAVDPTGLLNPGKILG